MNKDTLRYVVVMVLTAAAVFLLFYILTFPSGEVSSSAKFAGKWVPPLQNVTVVRQIHPTDGSPDYLEAGPGLLSGFHQLRFSGIAVRLANMPKDRVYLMAKDDNIVDLDVWIYSPVDDLPTR